MRTICLIMTLSLISLFSFSQEQLDKKITSFFETYKINAGDAYSSLFADNKWMKDKATDLQMNRLKLEQFISTLGEYFGYEPITQKKVGESYVLKSFLLKYERQPIRMTFIYYKASEAWVLQNFIYDSDIDEELKESAKVYRLQYNW